MCGVKPSKDGEKISVKPLLVYSIESFFPFQQNYNDLGNGPTGFLMFA